MASLLGALAFFEEGFEGVGAGEIVEEALAFVGVHVGGGEEFGALFAELLEPGFVFGAELLFKFFAEALRQSRALAGGGDGDLERAAMRYGRVVEVAKLGNVHDVAEHAAAESFVVDVLMQFVRGSGGDNEEHAFEVGWLAGAREPLQPAGGSPGLHLFGGLRSDHANDSVGVKEAGDFVLGDGACADDETGPAREFNEHGEKARGRSLFGNRLHGFILTEIEGRKGVESQNETLEIEH